MMVAMTDVTQILNAIEQGDPAASDKLLPLVYEELRVLARQRLANEKPGQTLQATALVHEAYLRLVGKDNDQSWDNRGHFFAAAAEAMRRIVIEIARKKRGPKQGGHLERVSISDIELGIDGVNVDMLSLDEALARLEEHDRRKALLVKLRFFTGLSHQQAAEALGISTSTADNDWAYAKAWLRVRLGA
jgi:RNA polymerase sigma factor (TIGR02999 family)